MGTSRWDGVNGSSWGFGLGKKFTAVCVPYSPTLWLLIASISPPAKPDCVDWALGAGGLRRGRVQIPPGANSFSSPEQGMDDICKHCPVLGGGAPPPPPPPGEISGPGVLCAKTRRHRVWPLRRGPFVERRGSITLGSKTLHL